MFIPYKIEEDYEFPTQPWFVYFTITACFAVHIYLFRFASLSTRENIFYIYGTIPADFSWYSPLTCTFLHGSWLHILGNMLFLWIYGRYCEKAIGTWKFILLYVVGAYSSMIAHVLSVPPFMNDDPAIGASGAISAVMGAFLILFPKVKVKFLVLTFARPLPSHGPAWFILCFWFLIQLLSGVQFFGENNHVAFWAHIAGFASGALLGTLYLYLHRHSMRKMAEPEDIPDKKRLLSAWQTFCRNGTTPLELSETTAEQPVIAHFDDPELEVIHTLLKNDRETAYYALLSAFQQANRDNNYPLMLTFYYRLLLQYDHLYLDGDIHLYGAIAAARLQHINLAAYGFFLAAASGSVSSSDQLIRGTMNILERLGEPEQAGRLARFILH